MLRLCGFRISNYHNKVRIVLLEKEIAFEEDDTCRPSQDDAYLARSPMGKAPFLELEGGARLSESQVICEYLEEAYPQKPLLHPLGRAKVRELVAHMELHMELVARRLYGSVFFKREISDCPAFVHLPLVSLASKLAYGRDALEDMAQVKPYLRMLGERPAFHRVNEDRKAATRQ